jgi:hypothetical protein
MRVEASDPGAYATNSSFSQLDWYDENSVLRVPNSSWGRIDVDVQGHDSEFRYLNVGAATSAGTAWMVGNLPIFPDPDDRTWPQTIYFDINDLGVTEG